ncbi:hypothetical protein [Phyllobacterium sp. SB3]|uniref:hypothetical protein n=1 Tax=Phyllobacterium sp. SB3 TaxID=3156073 RepID=UPI0032AF478E
MNDDWLIAPHKGIGRLAFGLSPEAVSSMASLYGMPSPLMSHADVATDGEDVIAQYGATMSADTIAAVRRAAREQTNLATQNLTTGRTPILLEYRDGQLEGVTVEARHKETNFKGTLIFSRSALEVLRLFERTNEAPGRYRSDEAAFDNIAVSLYRFSTTSSNGEVRTVSEAAPDFKERSVTLRREPYRPADELDQFVTFSFD